MTSSKSLYNYVLVSNICKLKASTLTVEDSVEASCATECQALCQKNDCCMVRTTQSFYNLFLRYWNLHND